MRPVLICAALMSAAPSLAADLDATKALYSPAPAFSWDRFYIGANIGGVWSDNGSIEFPSDTTSYFKTYNSSTRGASIGGVQGGYNYQIGKIVLGFEGDISISGLKSNSDLMFINNYYVYLYEKYYISASYETEWYGTFRARLGLSPVDRLLIYATGGLAFGKTTSRLNTSWTIQGTCSGCAIDASAKLPQQSEVKFGWAAGAGAEYALTNNISIRAEYIHVDLGTIDYTAVSSSWPIITSNFSAENTFDTARAGVNWLF